MKLGRVVGVTDAVVKLPQGFQVAASHCGVKPGASAEKDDLALFVSDRPSSAAGVFTTNLVCGAPVKVSRERVPGSRVRAVLMNSGNANACTGQQGIADAEQLTARVGELIGAAANDVLICSTGVIGRLLPVSKMVAALPQLVEGLGPTPEHALAGARAIMTTDTVPKLATTVAMVGGKEVRLTGVCKGAAMIAPNMATMLCVIMSDVAVPAELATGMLKLAVNQSFNRISVDGHESTSDSVLFLANGAAGVTPELPGDRRALQTALDQVTRELALAIIADAEGAEHFIHIHVRGCRDEGEAARLARTIADSPLVKTAIYGADPNWGRIVSAAGYAGVPFAESDLSLTMNGVELYRQGVPQPFDAAAVSAGLRNQRHVEVELTLTLGTAETEFWTSDLTKEYVALNADYTT